MSSRLFIFFKKQQQLCFCWILLDGQENLEKSEVQAIIESTPELDMDLAGCKGTRYQTDDSTFYRDYLKLAKS